MLAMMCASVYAAEIPYSVSVDYTKNKATITGTAPEKSEQIIMQVLSKGKTFGDLAEAAAAEIPDMSVVLWHDQVSVSEDGAFTFDVGFSPELPAGNYNAYIVASNMNDTRTEFKLALVGSEMYAANVESLNSYAESGDAEGFALIVKDEEGVSHMGFDLSVLNQLTGSGNLDAYMNYVADNNLTTADSEYNNKVFNTFMLMEALEQGNIVENIDSYIYDTIYAETDLTANYEKYITNEAAQKHMTKKLSGGEYETLDGFEKSIEAALVLSTVYYADGYGEVKEILAIYGSSVGISGSASDSVYKSLSGKDYENAPALAGAYERYKEPDSGNGNNGISSGNNGGNGGGGGGGNSGVKGTSTTMNGQYQSVSGEAAAPRKIDIPFVDIEDIEWASPAIIALADKGIVAGKGDGYFMPNDNITREEFVKILVNAMGYGNESYKGNVFADVTEEDWFCSFVNIAYTKKLVNGIGDDMFGTGQLISRQDMVVMLYNALKMREAELPPGEADFDDKDKVAEYAVNAVDTLYTMGVVNGVSDSEFDPLGNATRAQAAKVVYGLLEYLQ